MTCTTVVSKEITNTGERGIPTAAYAAAATRPITIRHTMYADVAPVPRSHFLARSQETTIGSHASAVKITIETPILRFAIPPKYSGPIRTHKAAATTMPTTK